MDTDTQEPQECKGNLRSHKGAGPWCWAEKAALRKIREACGNTGDGAAMLSTYWALTEIASDEQADSFQATQDYIARKAGLSLASVKRKLKVLRELGLISITTPDLRAPGSYGILSLAHSEPALAHSEPALAHSEPALAHAEPALAHSRKRAQRATVEESFEESKEEIAEAGPAAHSPSFFVLREGEEQTEALIRELSAKPEYASKDVRFVLRKLIDFHTDKRITPTSYKLEEWLKTERVTGGDQPPSTAPQGIASEGPLPLEIQRKQL